eukprot:gene8806-6339_t
MELFIGNSWTLDLAKMPKYAEWKGEWHYEIDRQMIQLILECTETDEFGNRKITDTMKAHFKNNIVDRMRGNTLHIQWKAPKDIGRRYSSNDVDKSSKGFCASGNLGVHSKYIKNTIYQQANWVDYDMVKGHPTLLVCVGNQLNITNGLPAIQRYIDNFDAIAEEMIAYHSCIGETDEETQLFRLTKGDIKELHNLTIYGGGETTWFRQIETGDEKKGKLPKPVANKAKMHPKYNEFKTEIRRVADLVYDSNPELVKLVCAVEEGHEELPIHKKKSRTMSYFCGILENECLRHAYNYGVKAGLFEANRIDLCMDGFTAPRPEGKDLDFHVAEMNNLTGDAGREKAFFCFRDKTETAAGNNGKSFMFKILAGLFPKLVEATPYKVFEENYNNSHKFIIGWKNKRIIYCDEGTNKKVKPELVKCVGAGEPIPFEILFGTRGELIPMFKLFLCSNVMFNVGKDNGAVFNRYKELTFRSHFDADRETDDAESLEFKADTCLVETLLANYRAELVHLFIEYAKKYYEKGLPRIPAEFLEATNDTKMGNNPFAVWFKKHYKASDAETAKVSLDSLMNFNANQFNEDTLTQLYDQFHVRSCDLMNQLKGLDAKQLEREPALQRELTMVNNIMAQILKLVMLNVPVFVLDPVLEQAYMSSPIKRVMYTDIAQYLIQNISPNAQFNSIVTNSQAGLKSVLCVPYFTTTSAACAGVSPLLSPFDTAGATTSPLCLLNNFNVKISGDNALLDNALYTYQTFLEHMYGCNSYSAGSQYGIGGDGLISQLDFETAYCFHYVNVSRMPAMELSVGKSVQILGVNQSAKAIDLYVFTEFGCSIDLDVLKGARVSA